MRELSSVEVNEVSGSGFIQDGFSSVGGWIGNAGYNLVSSQLTVNIPVIGDVSLSKIFPELGNTIGSAIGSTVGGTIETGLASIPYVGGLINKLLGN